jgi:hypothetical protein
MEVIYGRIPAIPSGHGLGEVALGSAARKHFGDQCLRHSQEFPGDFVGIFMSEVYMEEGEFVTLEIQIGWLDHELEKARTKHVLLFAHVPLVWPRQVAPHMRFPKGSESWNFSDAHPQIRALLARHGNVLAQYAGHLHVNGLKVLDGIHYVTTSGLTTYPGEYRLVTVTRDSIAHRCVRLPTKAGEQRVWVDCADGEHPTADMFHEGLPDERDFMIRYRP